MSDRLDREIDELLAQLGFVETESRQAPRPVPVRRSRRRRPFPGSPLRLMLVSAALAILLGLVPLGALRPLLVAAAALCAVAYFTWLFEPDDASSAEPASWFDRFYYWLYGS